MEYYQCDISDTKAVDEMWQKVITKHGKVEILINNAARTLGKRIKDLSFDQFKKTLEINFLSIVYLTKLFIG